MITRFTGSLLCLQIKATLVIAWQISCVQTGHILILTTVVVLRVPTIQHVHTEL